MPCIRGTAGSLPDRATPHLDRAAGRGTPSVCHGPRLCPSYGTGPPVPCPEAPDALRGSTAQGQGPSRDPWWIRARRRVRRIARRRGVPIRAYPGVPTTQRGAVTVVARRQGSRDSPWVPGAPGRRAIPNGPPHIARASEMSSSAGRLQFPVRRRLAYERPTGSNSPDVNAGHRRTSASAAEDGSRAQAVGRGSVRGSAAGGGCRPAGSRSHG